jgi:hypothetical protein
MERRQIWSEIEAKARNAIRKDIDQNETNKLERFRTK